METRGNQGGNAGNQGGNAGNQDGNVGNGGGNAGNQGGNQGNSSSGSSCLLLRLKFLSVRGAFRFPAFMGRCPTISHAIFAFSTSWMRSP